MRRDSKSNKRHFEELLVKYKRHPYLFDPEFLRSGSFDYCEMDSNSPNFRKMFYFNVYDACF
jgi:hypothetical protein